MSPRQVVDTTAPKFFGFNYDGIDTLKFSSFGGENAGLGGKGTQFALDDFTYQAVPEPSSILGTLTIGAFGATAILKRKMHKKV